MQAHIVEARIERERREREAPDLIRRTILEQGRFVVSMRKRDHWLRRICFDFRRQGVLQGGRRKGSLIVFTAGENFHAQAEREI